MDYAIVFIAGAVFGLFLARFYFKKYPNKL